jgi:predicted Zn-dependent peptidase
MQATAFQEHPYHWPVMGYEDDMKNGTNKTWSVILKHTMHQITVSVVVSGAIKTEEVKRLAQKYLEPIPAQPAPPKVHILNQYKLANEE